MPEPTDQLAITLTITEWNQLLQIMADGPYRIVAPLVAKINVQANAQTTGTANGPATIEQMAMPAPPSPRRTARQQE